MELFDRHKKYCCVYYMVYGLRLILSHEPEYEYMYFNQNMKYNLY